MSGVTVAVRLTKPASSLRLAVSADGEFDSPAFSAAAAPEGRVAKLSMTGLSPDTAYFCAIEIDGHIDTAKVGTFRTLPEAGPASFSCAFSGDAKSGSNHDVFSRLVTENPLFFIHLGDIHYDHVAVDDVAQFEAAYDKVLAQPNQAALYQQIPTLYMWDDHDFGPDNSHSGSPGRAAACEAYRLRVPHPPLVETGSTDAVYFTYEVGRVLFIFTDQRSMASPASATDNGSKTILGATQKDWFKGLLSDESNEGKLFVWICSRVWGGVPTTGADHWGGFTTERTELANHINNYCAGRFCVLSADMHSLAIDDGTNHDFATGGGAATPVFQASPLDMTGATTWGGATYSEGGRFTNNGQYGVMEVDDSGGSAINVSWKGYNSSGGLLVQYDWVATVS